MGSEIAVAVRHRGRIENREIPGSFAPVLAQHVPFLTDPFRGRTGTSVQKAWTSFPRIPDMQPHVSGLVVIDADTRWLGSAQDYIALDYVSLSTLIAYDVSGAVANFEDAWRAGHITEVRFSIPCRYGLQSRPWAEVAAERGWSPAALDDRVRQELITEFASRPETSPRLRGFAFGIPGWTLETFDANESGNIRLIEAMLDRGFTFPAGTGTAWREHWVEDARSRGNPVGPSVDPEARQAARAARALDADLVAATVTPRLQGPRL